MNEQKHSPWLPVSLAVVGLVVGYGLVAFRGDAEAKRYCPAHATSSVLTQHS